MRKTTKNLIPVSRAASDDPGVIEVLRQRMDAEWPVEGPRGGRYFAHGPVTITGPMPLDELDPTAALFLPGTMVLVGTRHLVRRVRT